jgi:hypothetical protein
MTPKEQEARRRLYMSGWLDGTKGICFVPRGRDPGDVTAYQEGNRHGATARLRAENYSRELYMDP